MDQLTYYRTVIQTLLNQYYRRANEQAASEGSEVSDRLALDPDRDQYLWFRFGWNEKTRVQHIIMYMCIKNGKIWVEEDSTNLCGG
ncbi:MAG: XisI protein [Plectolyngbya sp. WJT66-NPBG17]|nr:XisI protein [Plectolyngbya sp. WJT66-NPBG17]